MRSDPRTTRRSRDIVVIDKVMMTLGTDPIMTSDLMCITNMTTRAESVHGTLSIESRPGAGCTLRVEVPVAEV